MLTVISPAKNLDFDTSLPTAEFSQPILQNDMQELADVCKQLSPMDLGSLMSISDKLAGLNAARFQEWSLPFSPENARPAMFAFNGDVYTGLDAYTLSEAQIQEAQQHLKILSGLYGVLRPLDLMQAYRLEMGTKLTNPRGKNLYEFWGDIVTEELNKALAEQESNVLVNLASNEYFKVVKTRKLNAQVITPVFKDKKNGQYKVISFFAKKARGMMARFIIESKARDVNALTHFNSAGYEFNEAMSDAKQLVFTREEQ